MIVSIATAQLIRKIVCSFVIICRCTDQKIIATLPKQLVGSTLPIKLVVIPATLENVIATPAMQVIDPFAGPVLIVTD